MQAILLLSNVIALFGALTSGTALTYKLLAHERACYFADVEVKGAKVAFYFAVRTLPHVDKLLKKSGLTQCKVQSGGSFDVDYSVVGPNEKVILDGTKERQGDYVFTANEVGEYRFCFNNEMSTFAEKMVDFEIAACLPTVDDMLAHFLIAFSHVQIENEKRAQLPSKQGTTPEQTSVLEESIIKLSSQLSTITRNQKYFRTRENRNFSTVRSTERRIWNFSVIEGLMMVTMAGLQVFIVRFFFQGARKGTSTFEQFEAKAKTDDRKDTCDELIVEVASGLLLGILLEYSTTKSFSRSAGSTSEIVSV